MIFTLNSFAQTETTSLSTQDQASPVTKTIIIQPNVGNLPAIQARMVCQQGPGGWAGGCYYIGIFCTNGNGLTVSVEVKNCAASLVHMLPDLDNVPKNIPLDVEVKFLEQSLNSANDIAQLQQYKNGTYVVADAVSYQTENTNIIIKPGVYKVANSKLLTLMSAE